MDIHFSQFWSWKPKVRGPIYVSDTSHDRVCEVSFLKVPPSQLKYLPKASLPSIFTLGTGISPQGLRGTQTLGLEHRRAASLIFVLEASFASVQRTHWWSGVKKMDAGGMARKYRRPSCLTCCGCVFRLQTGPQGGFWEFLRVKSTGLPRVGCGWGRTKNRRSLPD